jgi:hypothetical protein
MAPIPSHAVAVLAALAMLSCAAPAAHADGNFDPAFGTNGLQVIHPPRADVGAHLFRLGLTPTSEILAGGSETIQNGFRGGADTVFHAERLSATGRPLGYGPVESGFGSDEQTAQAEVVDPLGRMYLGGGVREPHGFGLHHLGVFRYTADGQEDDAFGRFELDFPGRDSTITDMALAPDGKLIVAGTSALPVGAGFDVAAQSSVGFVLRVFTSGPQAGQIDTGFSTATTGRFAGVDGVHVVRFPGGTDLQRVAAVVVQPTGSSYRVIAAGDAGNGNGFAAYRADGSVDTSWGRLGTGAQSYPVPGLHVVDVALEPGGGLATIANNGAGVVLLRTGATGGQSSTLVAAPAKTVVNVVTPQYAAGGLVVNDNGRIVVLLTQAIYRANTTVPDHPFAELQLSRMYVRRYVPDPRSGGAHPEGAFAGDGIRTIEAGPALTAGPLALQPDCKLLAGGSTTHNYVIARLDQAQFTGTTFIQRAATGFFGTEICKQSEVGVLVERASRGRFRPFGRVPLGRKPGGRVRIGWNLRVNGRRLAPGTYHVRLRALRDGQVFAVSRTFRLRIR